MGFPASVPRTESRSPDTTASGYNFHFLPFREIFRHGQKGL